MSDEQIVVVTHTDGFFQGAMDNASGMATGIDIARHYAAMPRAQRPRTMVFMALPDHHHGEAGRTLAIKTYDWSKVALILNAEHTSQTLLYFYNQDLVTSNAISARRWYVSGSPGAAAAGEAIVPGLQRLGLPDSGEERRRFAGRR